MVFCRVILIALMCYTSHAFAQQYTVDLNELVVNANSLNNTEVVVIGEIIGDILPRGNYSWVSIQQNAMQMSLWVPTVLLKDVRFKGDYSTQGDVVEAAGEFMRADPALGGDMRVKVEGFRIIRYGKKIDHPLAVEKIETAVVIALILFILIFLGARIKRVKQRG